MKEDAKFLLNKIWEITIEQVQQIHLWKKMWQNIVNILHYIYIFHLGFEEMYYGRYLDEIIS